MRIEWIDDDAPPPPQGVIAFGEAAHALFALVERRLADEQPRWWATAHGDGLIVTGPGETLPWLDGVRYIAPRPEAPTLWLPTHRRPALPLDLLAAAATRRHARSPLLLWPEPAQFMPLDRLRNVEAALLHRIRRRWGLRGSNE